MKIFGGNMGVWKVEISPIQIDLDLTKITKPVMDLYVLRVEISDGNSKNKTKRTASQV